MAKVIITISDNPQKESPSQIKATVDFKPVIKLNEPCTPAQDTALKFLQMLTKEK